MAQDLASRNSSYTTAQILERTLAITASATTRLKFKKLSGWQVAMAEEKHLVAPDTLRPLAGGGPNGRKGFDGRYSKHVAEVYRDPEKRERYQNRAAEINSEVRVGSVDSLQRTQKKAMQRLTAFLGELGEQEVHIVMMAVPSQTRPTLFTTSGFAASYYKLLADGRRGHQQFVLMCKGGTLLEQAAKLPVSNIRGIPLARNEKRSENITMLKELISKISYHNIIDTVKY